MFSVSNLHQFQKQKQKCNHSYNLKTMSLCQTVITGYVTFALPHCNYSGIFHEILLSHRTLTILNISHTLNQDTSSFYDAITSWWTLLSNNPIMHIKPLQ